MDGMPTVIQEGIEADAISADACGIGALAAFVTGLALMMARLGGVFALVAVLSFFATVFLFIFCLHFYRRARAAAEDFHRTAHQMMWDHWMSTMPAGLRWVAPSRSTQAASALQKPPVNAQDPGRPDPPPLPPSTR